MSRLLAVYEPESPLPHAPTLAPVTADHQALLLDPLSKRELEVLRLLTTDLSSTAIAQELYISTNTVRTHIKNIYSKLNVHSRDEAVERSAKLGLL